MRKTRKYNVYAIVRSALRRLWLYSPQRRQALDRAKVRVPMTKKDGTPSKREAVVGYRCERCKEVFPMLKDIQVHHLCDIPNPFEMVFDDYIKAMWCPPEGLQVLCKVCHKEVHRKVTKSSKAKNKH